MKRLRWSGVLALLLLSGCAESDGDPATVTKIEAGRGATVVSMPDMVLDGTDIIPLAEVKLKSMPSSPGGEYHAELGGSEISVSISKASDGTLTVARSYREPGMSPHRKRYQVRRQGQKLVSGSGDLFVQGTDEGLLMLEADSGVEFIPRDFWIHYIRLEPAGRK